MAALPSSLKRRFLKDSSWAARSYYLLCHLDNTADFKAQRTRTYTRAYAQTHTETHTRRLAERVQARLFQGSGSEPKATFTVQCSDLLQIQCKVSELIETKMHFYVNALLARGSALMKPRVNRNSLKPLVGEFLFTGLTFFFSS